MFTILSSNIKEYTKEPSLIGCEDGLLKVQSLDFFKYKDILELSPEKIRNFKELEEDIKEINKTAGGTVGGALVGSLFGPFGAVVGGMAGGNKKKIKKKGTVYAIEFDNGDWITFKVKNGMLDNFNFKSFCKELNLESRFLKNNSSPF
jgi:hypothetical protein